MERYSNIRYAECTDYPKIFLSVYWGTHRLLKTPPLFEVDQLNRICHNRNNFIKNNFIKKHYNIPSIRTSGMIGKYAKIHKKTEILDETNRDIRDHVEYYKCEDNITLTIFSMDNYSGYHDLILAHGYILIEPLYCVNQNTYMKLF